MSLRKILPSLQAVFFVQSGAANKRVGLAHFKYDCFDETFTQHEKKFEELLKALASDLKVVYDAHKDDLPEVEKSRPRVRHAAMYATEEDEEEYEGDEGETQEITPELLKQFAEMAKAAKKQK